MPQVALMQIAGTSKRSLLRRADFRPEAPRPRLQAQLGLERQTSQCELSLPDAVQQLDAGDRDRRIPESLEA